jgi:hypothetical protein
MFERLKYLYSNGMINETHLDNAIAKGWLTEEEKSQIVGG